MSAFPFTAPFVSEEEERLERESLTKAERDLLERDIYGGTDAQEARGTETPEQVGTSLSSLRDFIENMPATTKASYLEALERAPDLVERESSVLDFLRCENFEVEKAAYRVCAYWKTPKAVFGDRRAFLPMTLDGAMMEDLEYLQKAIMLVLHEDDFGRPVCFWDRIRCTPVVVPRDSAVRCLWYGLQSLAMEGVAPKCGYVFVVNMQGYDIYKHFDRMMTKKWLCLLNCMPMRVRAMHYFTGSGRSVMDLVLPVIKQMAGKELRMRMLLHAGSSTEVFAHMKDFGLNQAHVDCLYSGLLRNGGTIRNWIDQQRQIEHERRRQQQEEENTDGQL